MEMFVCKPSALRLGEEPAANVNKYQKTDVFVATPYELRRLQVGASGSRLRFTPISLAEGLGTLARIPTIIEQVVAPRDSWISLKTLLQKAVTSKEAVRLAVIADLGEAFGDAIVLCSLLRIIKAHVARANIPVQISVLQRSYSSQIRDLLNLDLPEVQFISLPTHVDTIGQQDLVIDLSVNYPRADLPWIDGLLYGVGIEPNTVDPSEKRNHLLWTRITPVDREALALLRANDARPLVLIHWKASSPLRSMPNEVLKQVLEHVSATERFSVMVDMPLDFEIDGRVQDASLHAQSFAGLCRLVAYCDAIVTVDTATVHIADASDTPCLAIFTTQPPARFAAYYPNVKAINLTSQAIQGVFGAGTSSQRQAANTVWQNLSVQDVCDDLGDLVTRARPSRA